MENKETGLPERRTRAESRARPFCASGGPQEDETE